MPDHVFRNDGGRFVDVSEQAGVRAADRDGRGLGVVAADLDDDGRVDLYVANDMTANFLFRNQGGFSFQETAAESGVAANAEGGYLAGMGIACGDLDGDGRLDLAVTNFYGESTTFYQNLGAGQFVDRTAAIGLAAPSRNLLGFGTAFFDANNDGRLDLATANGHVNDIRPNCSLRHARATAPGRGRRPAHRRVRRAGAPWQVLRRGRGLAVGDLDNDGRLDLLIVAEGEPLAYFHNQGPAGHFVTLQLEGAATELQPRCRRRTRHPHRGRPPPGRPAVRRRQLPVGERPSASLRPGRVDPHRGDRGPLALRTRRPLHRSGGRHRIPPPRGPGPGQPASRLAAVSFNSAMIAPGSFTITSMVVSEPSSVTLAVLVPLSSPAAGVAVRGHA